MWAYLRIRKYMYVEICREEERRAGISETERMGRE
jgi:hypothetical protein